jgi:hypothetical protein
MIKSEKMILRNLKELFRNHRNSIQKVLGYAAEPEVYKRLRKANIKHHIQPPDSEVDVLVYNKKCQIKIIGIRHVGGRHKDKNKVQLCMRHSGDEKAVESYKTKDIDVFIFVNANHPDLPDVFKIPGKDIFKLQKKNKRESMTKSGYYPTMVTVSKKDLLKYKWDI